MGSGHNKHFELSLWGQKKQIECGMIDGKGKVANMENRLSRLLAWRLIWLIEVCGWSFRAAWGKGNSSPFKSI